MIEYYHKPVALWQNSAWTNRADHNFPLTKTYGSIKGHEQLKSFANSQVEWLHKHHADDFFACDDWLKKIVEEELLFNSQEANLNHIQGNGIGVIEADQGNLMLHAGGPNASVLYLTQINLESSKEEQVVRRWKTKSLDWKFAKNESIYQVDTSNGFNSPSVAVRTTQTCFLYSICQEDSSHVLTQRDIIQTRERMMSIRHSPFHPQSLLIFCEDGSLYEYDPHHLAKTEMILKPQLKRGDGNQLTEWMDCHYSDSPYVHYVSTVTGVSSIDRRVKDALVSTIIQSNHIFSKKESLSCVSIEAKRDPNGITFATTSSIYNADIRYANKVVTGQRHYMWDAPRKIQQFHSMEPPTTMIHNYNHGEVQLYRSDRGSSSGHHIEPEPHLIGTFLTSQRKNGKAAMSSLFRINRYGDVTVQYLQRDSDIASHYHTAFNREENEKVRESRGRRLKVCKKHGRTGEVEGFKLDIDKLPKRSRGEENNTISRKGIINQILIRISPHLQQFLQSPKSLREIQTWANDTYQTKWTEEMLKDALTILVEAKKLKTHVVAGNRDSPDQQTTSSLIVYSNQFVERLNAPEKFITWRGDKLKKLEEKKLGVNEIDFEELNNHWNAYLKFSEQEESTRGYHSRTESHAFYQKVVEDLSKAPAQRQRAQAPASHRTNFQMPSGKIPTVRTQERPRESLPSSSLDVMSQSSQVSISSSQGSQTRRSSTNFPVKKKKKGF
ncbi:hypothetical protein PROFUN_11748 [Planoprotostelium fungivorum]|uniref:Uncharacterized protein n=1 Tax=Planoprotostelium fungivorum TaxID=1890364 RepID=A0A2P6MYG0_9EUKA|nr:hypothetical protein PROFUN_11748 [Planoprotostelium fungivorum]